MLTKNQQKFLITLLKRRVTKKDNGIYDSRAFYRVVAYLRKNNLIQSVRQKNNMNEYRLTLKGSFLARVLASLDDVDEKTRKRFGLG